MRPFPITLQGLNKLRGELRQRVAVDRPRIRDDIARARAFGDLSENAEYDAAKGSQAQNENRIRELETKIAHAQIIDISMLSGPTICFGATIHLYDEDQETRWIYQIVGADESDIPAGKISIDSLLAKELIGKTEGTAFEFSTPRGEKYYVIEKVEYIVVP